MPETESYIGQPIEQKSKSNLRLLPEEDRICIFNEIYVGLYKKYIDISLSLANLSNNLK